MACERVRLPDGGFAIVCGTRRPQAKCGCGRPGTLLCDWRLPPGPQARKGKSTTCDAPICARCTKSPAPDKDLCPKHARAWAGWQARRAAS